jgi:hypothetical protein
MAEDLERLRRRRLAGDYPVPFFVRATEEEAERIRANAKAAGLPYTRLLAELGAAASGRDLRALVTLLEERARVRDELAALRYELRKVGVNLNQLAHRENSADVGGPAEPPTDAELRAAADAVRTAVERIVARLA